MGDTSPNLPAKAQMFMDLANQILAMTENCDSQDPLRDFVITKASACIDLALEETAETSQTAEVATKVEPSVSSTVTATTSETVKTETVMVEQTVEEDVYDENYPLTLAFVVRNVVGVQFNSIHFN